MNDAAASDEAARRRLDELIRLSPQASYAAISELIGRNHAYIQQYIKRGQPRRLSEGDRRRIAAYFGIGEWELGGPPETQTLAGFAESEGDLIFVPRFELNASAGAGTLVDRDRAASYAPFRLEQLRRLTSAGASKLSLLTVAGDSMYPTLADGDEILIDHSETAPRRDAIYAIRMEDALQVKRVSVNPITGRVTIKSDNPLYETWSNCDPGRIDLIGRVIWVGRRL